MESVTTEHIIIIVIIGYSLGLLLTMVGFICYWRPKTSPNNLVMMWCVGLAFSLIWPLYVCPCISAMYYFTAKLLPLLLNDERHLHAEGDEEDKDKEPYVKVDPLVVEAVDASLAVHLTPGATCAICCDKISIKRSHIRCGTSRSSSVIKVPKPLQAHPTDTCFTTCAHVFHYSCLDTWFHKKQSCPTCRTALSMAECQVLFGSGSRKKKKSRGSLHGTISTIDALSSHCESFVESETVKPELRKFPAPESFPSVHSFSSRQNSSRPLFSSAGHLSSLGSRHTLVNNAFTNSSRDVYSPFRNSYSYPG